MIRSLISIAVVVLTVPYISLNIGHHFQSEISSADNSATPWRRARLSYRIAKFSPFLWQAAATAEDETDLILSDFFFSQVLRGEQDAIVPQNHIDFLSDRPDNETWNAIRGRTLLQYGQFSDALTLAKKQDSVGFAPIQTVSALFTGDKEALLDGCEQWASCPKGWMHALPFETNFSETDTPNWKSMSESDQPIFLEWVLTNDSIQWDSAWTEDVLAHSADTEWRCTTLALATETQNVELLASTLEHFWGDNGSEWWFSYGHMMQDIPCHPNRFSDALTVAPEPLHNKFLLLQATAQTGLLNIANAQSTLKNIDLDAVETTQDERILAYHLRVLTRELAGSTKGMEKYIALGYPLEKALFSIHLGKAKLYQQAKTTAIQSLSVLNGYPIPPKLQQEYTDMLMLSKRLNGSASKIQIGQHPLEYDFMDDDGNFREWLVTYHGESLTTPIGTPMSILLLRFWRGEDKHADQLLQTHLESQIHPLSVMMGTHQRFLEASLRGDKALTSTTWKQFSRTQAWLNDVPFPQMLRTHPDWFNSPWLE